MQRRFIRINELASVPARKKEDGRADVPERPGRWPVSASTVWRWVAIGALPAPVRLGPSVSAWPIETIELFEANQAAMPAESSAQRATAAKASADARRAKREAAKVAQ